MSALKTYQSPANQVLIQDSEDINSFNPDPIQLPSFKSIPGFNKVQSLDISEVQEAIKSEGIKKNKITRSYERNGEEMQTEDFNSLFIQLKKVYPKLSREIFDTIIFSNDTPLYDPLYETLESLKWDNKDRLNDLCKVITSDTGTFDYRLILLQSWLLGIIESIYIEEPNVLQLILAGKQNTGKSYFLKYLLPDVLRRYFAFSQLDKEKDDELLMCQKLLIMDDEFSGKSKTDAKLIKRLLSANFFNLREPYGRKNITIRRIATLCATTNETQILNDPTGNRRNIVFEITGQFNYDLYNSVDKEQLFAQLVAMHKQGFKARLAPKMIELIEEYTASKHSETSIERECISMLFEEPFKASSDDWMTTTNIKMIIERETNQKVNPQKLGSVLRSMGYKNFQKKIGKENKGSGYAIIQKHLPIGNRW